MSFLNNARYRKFEDQANGDALRGLPRNDFPWVLKTESKTDKTGEIWHCTARVSSLKPDKSSANVEVEFEFEATCRVTDNTLKRMGFDPVRVEVVGEGRIAQLTESKILARTSHIDRLAELADPELVLFFAQVDKTYTREKKHEVIATRLAQRPFCRFSE